MKVRRKRRKRTVSSKRRVKRNPVRKIYVAKSRVHRRRKKRNPSTDFDIQSLVMQGAFGIGGALVNTLLSNLIGKIVFKDAATETQLNIVRLVSAVAIGYGATKTKMLDKNQIEALTVGMLTAVALPIAQKAFGLSGNMPFFMGSSVSSIMDNMGLSGVLEDNSGLSGLLEPEFDGYDDFADFI